MLLIDIKGTQGTDTDKAHLLSLVQKALADQGYNVILSTDAQKARDALPSSYHLSTDNLVCLHQARGVLNLESVSDTGAIDDRNHLIEAPVSFGAAPIGACETAPEPTVGETGTPP